VSIDLNLLKVRCPNTLTQKQSFQNEILSYQSDWERRGESTREQIVWTTVFTVMNQEASAKQAKRLKTLIQKIEDFEHTQCLTDMAR
jgi:hypothetical protein